MTFSSDILKFLIQEISVGVTAVIAICAILSRGKQDRRRATIDFITEQNRNEALKAARKTLRVAREADPNIARYANLEDSDEWKAITLILNAYEFLAVGVQEKAFDERIYKRLRCSQFLKDWELLHGFITQMRALRNQPTTFQDFERLYERWKRDPLKAEPKKWYQFW